MKKNLFLITSLLILLISEGMAQNSDKKEISVNVSTYSKQGDKVIVNANITLDKLRVSGNDVLTIIPVIRSLDGTDQMELQPVIINGSTRHKINSRSAAFNDYTYPENAAGIIKRKNGTPQFFRYSLDTNYQKWMRNSELFFIQSITGCNCKDKGNEMYPGRKLQLEAPYAPHFQTTYLVPAVEAVKQRTDSYSASLDYAVNKSDIDPHFKNNYVVLQEVDRIILEIKNDPNIIINKIIVTGYASPEGGAAYNMSLSEKRAKSFTGYLTSRHNLSANLITTNWIGEDWQGLSSAINKSNYAYRNDLLQIIDNTNDINKRKSLLKNLQNGEVYRNLLANYYPALRRNSYDISYTVRGLNVDQAKDIIKTKPQQLSLNEMFMVANSYEKGSKDFKETFNIAVGLYPDDPVARFNSFASDIETGSFEHAISGLEQSNKPEGWNNLAIALFHKGDYQRASRYFEKASLAGLKEAAHNLSEYNKWLENKDN